jgi:hypothetical protein
MSRSQRPVACPPAPDVTLSDATRPCAPRVDDRESQT